MLIKAPAKINLTLDVKQKLDNGYHRLATVMAKLPLEDELEFLSWPEEQIIIEGDNNSTKKQTDNLIFRAGKLLQETYDIRHGFVCRVIKNIPCKAGLGGGSSNAAATLLALNKLWELKLSKNELLGLAQKLGSDVPFFINSAQVVLEPNHGDFSESPEQFTLPDLPMGYVLLIKPRFSISTAHAFGLLGLAAVTRANKRAELEVGQGLADNDLAKIAENTSNDFQTSLWTKRSLYPKLEKLLLGQGALNVTLTGTGSAIYAFFTTKVKAEKARHELMMKHKSLKAFLVTTKWIAKAEIYD